jgi:hypothetical protein
LIAGGEATVEVLVNNEPLSNATVSLGDETIGATNTTGIVSTSLPQRPAQNQVQLVVESGVIREERTLSVAQFRLSATPARPLGLPDQNISIQATAGSEPIKNVPILRANTTVGTTDTNGSIIHPLKTITQTTFRANYVGKEATVQVQNRLLPVGLRVVSVIFVFGIILIIIDRQYNLFTRSQRRVSQLNDRFYGGVRSVLLRSTLLTRMLSTLQEHGLSASMITLLGMIKMRLLSLWAQFPESPVGYLVRFGKQTLQSFITQFKRNNDTEQQTAETRHETDDTTLRSTAKEETSQTVQQLWTTFIGLVFGRIMQTKTPGEVARAAIDKGFPQKPVNRLTNAFRTAEYGPSESDEAQTEAKAALSEIESFEYHSIESDETKE